MKSLSMGMLVLAGEKGFSSNDWLLFRRVMCVPYRKKRFAALDTVQCDPSKKAKSDG